MAGKARRRSGRFVLRIDPALHTSLAREAASTGLSLNEYCAMRLAQPPGHLPPAAAAAVERAAAVAGASLLGVAVFGSWARGTLGDRSDVDLLIVLDGTVAVGRDLYRAWDRAPLSWDGHPVEPHFVQLPAPGAPLSSVWAEVAVDGTVLFERDFAVSRHLVGIRQAITAGRIVRRVIHGQPYWVEAA